MYPSPIWDYFLTPTGAFYTEVMTLNGYLWLHVCFMQKMPMHIKQRLLDYQDISCM